MNPVTRVTIQAHKKVTLQTFAATFEADDVQTKALLDLFAKYALKWAKNGWGGFVGPTGVLMTNPTMRHGDATESLAALTQLIDQMGAAVVEKTFTTHLGFMEFAQFFASRTTLVRVSGS